MPVITIVKLSSEVAIDDQADAYCGAPQLTIERTLVHIHEPFLFACDTWKTCEQDCHRNRADHARGRSHLRRFQPCRFIVREFLADVVQDVICAEEILWHFVGGPLNWRPARGRLRGSQK